jgi:EAL domain-containing protein (putative c-di-GMP-specific phosphodiesterase class I)
LLRWHNPNLGQIPPDKFIAVAEDTGLIDSIGKWVLTTACRQAALWREHFCQPIYVAVNLSPRQLRNGELVEFIDTTLRESGLPASGLELEITERLMMDPTSNAIAYLQQLEHMGIRIAIDDFGTGYSSLQYIKQLPINTVKIDRSFVKNLPIAEDDASLVRAIIAMAHSMNLKVVAEGIETSAHVDYLQTIACDRGQGFYYGKPVTAQEFERFFGTSIPATTAAGRTQLQLGYG